MSTDRSWRYDAACASPRVDPAWFFHEPHDSLTKEQAEQKAKAVCGKCPVQAECLASALAHGEQGIWGGTTELERWAMPGATRLGSGSRTSNYLPFRRKSTRDLCACGNGKTLRAVRCSVCVRANRQENTK